MTLRGVDVVGPTCIDECLVSMGKVDVSDPLAWEDVVFRGFTWSGNTTTPASPGLLVEGPLTLKRPVWSDLSIVLLALSPVGLMQGREMIVQMTQPQSERMTWFYAHMGNMIGAGIAFHTAFAVFGAGRVFDFQLPGAWQVVPW